MAGGPDWGAVAGDLAAIVALRVDGVPFTWRDVLVAAAARGSTRPLVSRAEAADAAYAGLDDDAREELNRALPAQELALRQRRGLYSADEYAAWLVRWQVSLGDVRGHLRRTLALERAVAAADPGDGDGDGGHPPDDDGDRGVDLVRVAAVVTGFLEEEADALAYDLVLALDPVPATTTLEDRDSLLRDAVATAAEVRDAAVDERAIADSLDRHRLDWTRLEGDSLALDSADAAREALLCVTLDRRPLGAVAADVGVDLRGFDLAVVDAPEALSPLLIGAQAGAVLGPVVLDGHHLLLAVRERHDALRDPVARERARVDIVRRAAERAVAQRVRWDAP